MKLLTPKQYERRVMFALIAIPVGALTMVAIIIYNIVGVFAK